jgi:hypothetical protein
VESPALHNRPDIAMFKASQIINRTIVRKCASMDEDCITNLVYPCQEECPPKEKVTYFLLVLLITKKFFLRKI